MNKAQLYKSVDYYRACLGFSNDQPVNALKLAQSLRNVVVQSADFDRSLRGVLSIGDFGSSHLIILNSNRSGYERNYDCGHELMHIYFSGNNPSVYSQNIYACADKVSQNSYVEWEANEGSAELTVPYRALLPLVKSMYCNYFAQKNTFGLYPFCEWASQKFQVSPRVIEIRLESLKYEIDQYLNGTPIDKIRILSKTQQERLGIQVQSLAAKEDIKFFESFSNWAPDRSTAGSITAPVSW